MTNKETNASEIVNEQPFSSGHSHADESGTYDESNHHRHRHRLALGAPSRFQLPIIITSVAASVLLRALVSSTPSIPYNIPNVQLTSHPQDETIIVTAIPKITDDFGSINDIGWYGSA